MCGELESVVTQVIMVCVRALPYHSHSQNLENHKEPQNRWSSRQNSNQAPPKYKPDILPPEPSCSLVLW